MNHSADHTDENNTGIFKAWIGAFRLHTLPLSLSGLILGNSMAYHEGKSYWLIWMLSILTALLLQILSNLANDLGDFLHGTDSDKRTGPKRAVQSGAISATSMKRAVVICIVLSLAAGIGLLAASFKNTGLLATGLLLLTGLLAIWAAWHYTASKNPYGYKGWGDLFVFIFFGLVAVIGPYYLQTGGFSLDTVLPAAAMGAFSTAVLNLNNIRDRVNDMESGKITMAVKLGDRGARLYHLLVLVIGGILMARYSVIVFSLVVQFVAVLALLSVFLFYNGFMVFKVKDNRRFYVLLKQLSMSIFLFVLFYSLMLIIS